jgi:hypothetical protein
MDPLSFTYFNSVEKKLETSQNAYMVCTPSSWVQIWEWTQLKMFGFQSYKSTRKNTKMF